MEIDGRGPLSAQIQFDDALDIATCFGARISGALLQTFAQPTPPGKWFRIIKTEEGVATIEQKLEQEIRRSEVPQPWGSDRVLASGVGSRLRVVAIRPGYAMPKQRHLHRSEHWTVLSGEGWIRLAQPGRPIELFGAKRGDCLALAPGEWHQVGVNASAEHTLVVLQVWFGDDLSEDDVELAEAA